jgi:hypothetical protein
MRSDIDHILKSFHHRISTLEALCAGHECDAVVVFNPSMRFREFCKVVYHGKQGLILRLFESDGVRMAEIVMKDSMEKLRVKLADLKEYRKTSEVRR